MGTKLEYLGEYQIPAWAVVYFAYGDCDHLTDEDVEQADEFYKELGGGEYLTMDYGEENEFTPYPAFGLASATVATKIYKSAK